MSYQMTNIICFFSSTTQRLFLEKGGFLKLRPHVKTMTDNVLIKLTRTEIEFMYYQLLDYLSGHRSSDPDYYKAKGLASKLGKKLDPEQQVFK